MKSILFLLLLTTGIPAQYPQYISFSDNTNDHWLFLGRTDTVTGNWTHLTPLPQALYGVNCFYWQDSGKVFLCGGSTLTTLQTGCYFYNPVNGMYSNKAPLPSARTLGKLVKVRDSLYLIGSLRNDFTNPDGLIFKYSPHQDSWILKDTMPVPFVHECAVCVWKDSLIFCIGGSVNGFGGATAIVRIFNPWNNSWRTLSQPFPQTTTTGGAGCLNDSTIVMLGGYGTGFLNTVYLGRLNFSSDTINITWNYFDETPYNQGVYRVGTGKSGDFVLFGPVMKNSTVYNQIWGLRIGSDTLWRKFSPNTLDAAGNRSTIGVSESIDSVHFYMFGGFSNPNVIAESEQFIFSPPIIGIIPNINSSENFNLSQNYPNPFNPCTTISFELPVSCNVKILVTDMLGRNFVILADSRMNAGAHSIQFDASSISSGIYFYTMKAGEFIATKKMLLLK